MEFGDFWELQAEAWVRRHRIPLFLHIRAVAAPVSSSR